MFDLLRYIIQILENLQIQYMLSGSLAFNLYAIPRATRDIDMVVELQEENIKLFIEEINDDFYFHEPTIKEEIKRTGMFNIIHFKSGFKVDFIVRTNHLYEVQKFKRRKQVEYYNTKIWVITLEDLILSKLIWIQQLESEMQKRDIQSLLENKKLNIKYVKYWCEELKLKTYNLINYE